MDTPLPTAVAPPTPKPPAPPVVEPTPTPTPEPTPTPATEPKPIRNASDPKPGEKGYEPIEVRIGRRVKEAQAKEAADKGRSAAEKAVADKAAAEKAAADKLAAEGVKPDVEITDDQLEQQIATETKGLDPKQGKAWGDLRRSERALKRGQKDLVPAAELTKLQTELAAAQKQIEAVNTAPPAQPEEVAKLKSELEALTKRDQDRENELMIAKVERTEAFQNAVTKPLEKVKSTVAKIAKKIEASPDKLMAALTDTSDNQSDLLVAAVEHMNEVDKMNFLALVGKVADVNEKADVLRAGAKEALEKISAKTSSDTEAQQRAQKEAVRANHITTWDKLKAELPDVLTPVEGDDDVTKAWNKAQVDAETFARDTDFSSLRPEVQAQLKQRAAIHPLLMGKLQALEAQIVTEKEATQAALKRLEKFEKSTPGNDANRQPNVDDTDPAKGETDWVKRVDARLTAAGIR